MSEILGKIIEKLYTYIFRVINFSLFIFKRYPDVIDCLDSISVINEKKLSVSRFGDGELNIIRGIGWGFQNYDKELANRLIEVLGSDDPNIAICIPDVFRDRSRFTKTVRHFWFHQVLNNLYHWNKYTLKGKSYMDTQFTRFYMD